MESLMTKLYHIVTGIEQAANFLETPPKNIQNKTKSVVQFDKLTVRRF